jgi:phage tail-like protein
MSTRKSDPVLSFQFSIEVSGLIPINGYFTEIAGLETEYQVIEHKTTNILGQPYTQKIPGRPRWTEVTLKRGLTDSMGFWMWHRMVGVGMVALARASVSIVMYDRHYSPLAQWDLDKAWPSKVSGPQINSGSSDIAVEQLTLVHEGITRSFFPGVSLSIPGVPDLF